MVGLFGHSELSNEGYFILTPKLFPEQNLYVSINLFIRVCLSSGKKRFKGFIDLGFEDTLPSLPGQDT